LRRALESRAAAWAEAVAPGRGRVLAPGEPMEDAARDAFARHRGPLLLASADAPRLDERHARMALGDLADGADAALGPGMDGGWYLAALARPHDELLGLLAEDLAGRDVMGRVFELARTTGLDVGMLRMERLLREPQDVRAVLVDPLTEDRIRMALPTSG
jgi:glycosyltransferase A (GT-A) superfamily protein (DUF2064 family)